MSSPSPRHSKAHQSLLVMAFPIIISFWLRSLFTFVDTIYASFLSDAAIAAIGLALPFEFAMIAIWVGMSTGLTSYLSKAMGDNSVLVFDQVVSTVKKMLAVIVPLFGLMGVGIYFYAPHMGLPQEVWESFQIYGTVLVVGTAFTGFWSIIPDSIVKAHHDTKSTMIAGLLSSVVNLALNTLFLFVFHWGIFGIAFSTVLGRLAGLSYALYRSSVLERERRGDLVTDLKGEEETPMARPFRKILALTLPASLSYVLMASETSVINYLLAGVESSTAALAAYGIYYRVQMFCLMPIIATTIAALPFFARHAQQGNLGLIRANFFEALRLGMAYSLIILGPACYFGSDLIMHLLTDSESLIDYGRFAIYLVPLFCLVYVPYQLSRPLFEGYQRGMPTIYLSVLRHAVLAVPLCLLGRYLGPQLGYNGFQGLMVGLLAAAAISSATFMIWGLVFLSKVEQEDLQADPDAAKKIL